MSLRVTFRRWGTQETREVTYKDTELLPKVQERIHSPFDQKRIVTVLEVLNDAPRNCFQIVVDE